MLKKCFARQCLSLDFSYKSEEIVKDHHHHIETPSDDRLKGHEHFCWVLVRR